MTILDLIKKSATILNVEQILEDTSLEDFSAEDEATILSKNKTLARMFELAKLVINEVTSYSPLVYDTVLSSTNKQILLSKIFGLEKIIAVKNEYGDNVKYCIRDNCLCFEQDGKFTIIYQQYPMNDSMLYTINMFNGGISEDMLVAGLNSYYCLATGLYAEYNVYNAQYVDRLSRIKNLKVFSMPSRRWND